VGRVKKSGRSGGNGKGGKVVGKWRMQKSVKQCKGRRRERGKERGRK
jgi:hypothetical protein